MLAALGGITQQLTGIQERLAGVESRLAGVEVQVAGLRRQQGLVLEVAARQQIAGQLDAPYAQPVAAAAIPDLVRLLGPAAASAARANSARGPPSRAAAAIEQELRLCLTAVRELASVPSQLLKVQYTALNVRAARRPALLPGPARARDWPLSGGSGAPSAAGAARTARSRRSVALAGAATERALLARDARARHACEPWPRRPRPVACPPTQEAAPGAEAWLLPGGRLDLAAVGRYIGGCSDKPRHHQSREPQPSLPPPLPLGAYCHLARSCSVKL